MEILNLVIYVNVNIDYSNQWFNNQWMPPFRLFFFFFFWQNRCLLDVKCFFINLVELSDINYRSNIFIATYLFQLFLILYCLLIVEIYGTFMSSISSFSLDSLMINIRSVHSWIHTVFLLESQFNCLVMLIICYISLLINWVI